MTGRGTGRLDDALVVMARYPREGHVKSRLGASIGAAAAARVYRAFLADLALRFDADPRWVFHWTYDPPGSPFADEIANGAAAFPQSAGDLGQRMGGAIERLLGEGYRRVVLIGSDVPHLPLETVAQAFAALAGGAELVLGPVEDGGYCLIGSTRALPVFEGIEWGKSDVLAATLRRAERRGIAARLLAPTYDVDDADALGRLAGDLAAGRITLPATRNVLEELYPLRYI